MKDAFHGAPITGVRVSLLNMDSTIVVDSLPMMHYADRQGNLFDVIYHVSFPARKADFLLRASRQGYGTVYERLSIAGTEKESVAAPTLKLRRVMESTLGEVVVKATKVKMYYKGDTVVYNADAFKLPNGSMLDELIKQLPGVTMNIHGEIFVNGRKVDELMLGSRSFMHGNKKVLMENLPYYTVKDIKVYDKQSDMSVSLGYDVEPRKYVMDVNLKPEYSIGYIANVEGAGGTKKRWLGRGFLLGFTDKWRYSLMANSNNVNESRHIGQSGLWTPEKMPKSLVTTHSVAMDIDYASKNKYKKNNFNADFTYTDANSQTRSRHEQFMVGGKPMSLSQSMSDATNWGIKVHDEFTLIKPIYLINTFRFNYDRREGLGRSQFEQWDEDLLSARNYTSSISEGRCWSLSNSFRIAQNINKENQSRITYGFFYIHRDDQSGLGNRYDTWQHSTQTNDIRRNVNDVRHISKYMNTDAYLTIGGIGDNIVLALGEQLSYGSTDVHNYLYHPDTLMLPSHLDMLQNITDPANSYDEFTSTFANFTQIDFIKRAYYSFEPNSPIQIQYDRWTLGVDIPVEVYSLDYQRGVIDTLIHNTTVLVSPHASFRNVWGYAKYRFEANVKYKRYADELINRVPYRDDSNPLVVKLGNHGLKGKAMTQANIGYTFTRGKKMLNWNVKTSLNFNHCDVAQSVTFNPNTGVYTYQPMNVYGAYNLRTEFNISRAIDKDNRWTWQLNTDATLDHSIDHSMMEGETESHVNKVNNTFLHGGGHLQYNKDYLNMRLIGDIRWRNSQGKMRDFKTLNAIDYHCGISAQYTIPVLETTIVADGTVYGRSGYGNSTMNTTDFVLNASLKQSLLKGKLIAKVEAFDLLHQLSSTQYHVNAQGRTETWSRSLPRYVMFHLVYHWNRNPKKEFKK